MKLAFKYFLVCLLIYSCSNDLRIDLEGKELSKDFIYFTPSVGDTVTYGIVSKAGTFFGQNPTYKSLVPDNLFIKFTNLTTKAFVDQYEIDTLKIISNVTFLNASILKVRFSKDFFNPGNNIELLVKIGDKTIIRQTAIVPAALEDFKYQIVEEQIIPSEFRKNTSGFATIVNIKIKESNTQYYRLEALSTASNGQSRKIRLATEKVDDAFYINEITKISPSSTSVLQRYANYMNNNWLYYNPRLNDSTNIRGSYSEIFKNREPIKITLSPIERSTFFAELYTIIAIDVVNVFEEPAPYPSNLICDNCIGNFQIINPVVINL
jgi:hypothetical protein